MKTTLSQRRTFVIVEALALLFLADIAYSKFFVVVYASAKYPDLPRNLFESCAIWALGILPSITMPISIRRPSQVLLWSVYLMVYFPTIIVARYSSQTFPHVMGMTLAMLAGLMILSFPYFLPYILLPDLYLKKGMFWLLLCLLTLFFYAVVVIELGSIIRIVSLKDIYIQRFALMDSGASTLSGYAQTWTSMIIMPLLMTVGLWKRNWLLFLSATLGMVFFFAVSAQRIFLIGPVLLIVVFWAFRDDGKWFALKWLGGAIAAFIVPFIFPIGNQPLSFIFFDLVLNRSFINSGVLSTWYFDFFRHNPQVHFADVRGISWFVSSPYSISFKEELGWHFWGVRTDPNAHFMADGFAQLGYSGVLIECAIAAILFWLLDSVWYHRKIPLRFLVTAMAMQIPNFMNSAIHTTLLGGGFLFGLALLYFVPAMPQDPCDLNVRKPLVAED